MGLENRITIVSVCDDHYVVLLAALVKSIEVNHKTPEKIDIYVVEDRIRSRNKKKLMASVNPDIITFHWLKMTEVIPDGTKLPLDASFFPLNIYVRLWIPYFIPQNLSRVLYLDVDMIVLEDISKLWNTDINNKVIAGVVDRSENVSSYWGGVLNYQDLGLSPDTKYFNSGLLLIDPVKWRESDYTEQVINCVKNNIEFANYPDQYGLNVVFANQWFQLDPLWNVHSTSSEPHPYLIHFSNRKPIYESYDKNEVYRDIFKEYLNLTAWKGRKAVSEWQRIFKKAQIKLEKRLSGLFN